MVYYVPTVHKCPECDYKVMYSQSTPLATLFDEDGRPFCPKCLAKFLRAEISKVPVLDDTGEQEERVPHVYGGWHLCNSCHRPVTNGESCDNPVCKLGQSEKM